MTTPRERQSALAAWARARELYPGSRQFRVVYMRGWHARRAGRPVDECPYRRKPGWRVWRVAWLTGWSEGR